MPLRKTVDKLECLSLDKLENIVREVSLSCVEYFSESLHDRRISNVTSDLLDSFISRLQTLVFSLTPHYLHPQVVRLVVRTLSDLAREESLTDWEADQHSHHLRRRKLVRKQVLAQVCSLLCHPAVTELCLDSSLDLGFVKNVCQLIPDFDWLQSLDLGLWPCDKQGLLSGCQGSRLMFLPSLLSLALADVDTEIVKNISVFCPQLNSLQIRRSQLTDEAAYYLSKLRKLQKLKLLQVRNVSSYGYATLLRNLDDLIHLEGCDSFPAALNSLVSAKRQVQPRLRLERLQCDGPVTETDLQQLVAHCPRLTSLKIVYRPEEIQSSLDPVNPHLASLSLLTHLCDINIVSGDFYNHSVFRLLQTSPARITRLHLSDCDEMNLNSLMMIGQLCPSLVSLSLSCCHFSLDAEQRQKINEICSLQTMTPAHRPFSELRDITVKLSSPTHLILLKYILHYSDRLHSFSLEEIFQPLEDRFVLSLLSWGTWKQLQSFYLYNSSHLTLMAANAVIQSCPLVKYIGAVRTWGQVGREEFSAFQREIAYRNLDLTIG